MNQTSRIVNTTEIRKMIKALTPTGMEIEKTNETVIVTHSKFGEVLKAIKKGSSDVWIIRMNNNLFV